MNQNPNEERRRSGLTEDDRKFILSSAAAANKPEWKFGGFKISELTIIGSIVVSCFLFYLQTKEAIDGVKYLMVFSRNSDIYHTQITGQGFEQGKPTSRWVRNSNISTKEKGEEEHG